MYAGMEWPVFRLIPRGKIPLKGSHGFKDATTDLAQIEAWWTEVPDANVGIATGQVSGVLVIDVDPRHNANWQKALDELALPPTFVVRTWSGGFHYYFSLPSYDTRVRSGVDVLPGIDWRCNGGYVVAAGCHVKEGGAAGDYTIHDNNAIEEAPRKLLRRLRATAGNVSTARDESGQLVIADRKRNNTLASLGGLLRERGIGAKAIFHALEAINAEHCDPPLPIREVVKIARSVGGYAVKGGRS